MDTAVALVQAYLQVNGYFTVAEYPVLEALRGGRARAVTDLDNLAFRFPGAGHLTIHPGRGNSPDNLVSATDPRLGCPSGQVDMIVGEVKEGTARFNEATLDPAVVQVALVRFGCCLAQHASRMTRQLLSHGRGVFPDGHAVRLLAFGDAPPDLPPPRWTVIPMGHVVQYLQKYLKSHWAVLRHAQIREPVFGVLALVEKWSAGRDGEEAT